MDYDKPVTVSRRSSLAERQAALQHIYHQVLGRQPYAFEHRILAKAEQDFLKDKIGVKRFLKELGHSEVYLNAFYHHSSNLKFIDWCFKHFMGRAPRDKAEMRFYCDVLMTKGATALITELLDSEEYRKVFGCFTVPHVHEQRYYDSPKAYLESWILTHEYFGQRGWSLSTMFWHQLGLNCDAGTCRHPEADEVLDPPVSATGELLQHELLALLKAFKASPQEVLASLSPQQRVALKQSIQRLSHSNGQS